MRRIAVSLLMVLCVAFTGGRAQEIPSLKSQLDRRTDVKAGRHNEACRQLFSAVQQGLSSGEVGGFARFLGSQVRITLRDGESGYFSANQAYYVLQNYLKSRKLLNLNLTTMGESESSPYATGSASFNVRGTREYAQVYVALSPAGERWVISHINIY